MFYVTIEFFARAIAFYVLVFGNVFPQFADPDCYTHEFSVEKLDFFDIQDEETFFSHAEISRMVTSTLYQVSWSKFHRSSIA